MKKSELIKILMLDIEDSSGMDPYSQASFILARCISVGMLPPKFNGDVHRGDPFFDQYEWESEDE